MSGNREGGNTPFGGIPGEAATREREDEDAAILAGVKAVLELYRLGIGIQIVQFVGRDGASVQMYKRSTGMGLAYHMTRRELQDPTEGGLSALGVLRAWRKQA